MDEVRGFDAIQRIEFVRKWGGWCDAKNLGPQIRAILDNGVE